MCGIIEDTEGIYFGRIYIYFNCSLNNLIGDCLDFLSLKKFNGRKRFFFE